MGLIKIFLFTFSFFALINSVIHCQNYSKFLYFPLTVGNKWFFSQGNDGVIKLKLEIQKDTILSDGYSYSKFNLQSVYFEPGSRLHEKDSFYLRKVNNTIVEYPSRTILDYDMNIGDTVYSFRNAHYPSILDTVITKNVFGRYLSTYIYSFTPYDYYSLTDSIGFNTLWETSWNNWLPEYLLGCEIDGKVYGNVITGVEMQKELFVDYKLFQNYPNPFNPITRIQYSIPQSGFVSITIYDILGKEIRTLINEQKPKGNYVVDFDGSNLSSGVYFYRMNCGSFIDTKKFIFLR